MAEPVIVFAGAPGSGTRRLARLASAWGVQARAASALGSLRPQLAQAAAARPPAAWPAGAPGARRESLRGLALAGPGESGRAEPEAVSLVEDWAELVPEARFVLAYRHPLDAVARLGRGGLGRGPMRPAAALAAWQLCGERLLAAAGRHPERSLLCHADAALLDPDRFARLLRDRLGAELHEPRGTAPAAQPPVPTLTRFAAAAAELEPLLPEALDLYAELERRAPLADGIGNAAARGRSADEERRRLLDWGWGLEDERRRLLAEAAALQSQLENALARASEFETRHGELLAWGRYQEQQAALQALDNARLRAEAPPEAAAQRGAAARHALVAALKGFARASLPGPALRLAYRAWLAAGGRGQGLPAPAQPWQAAFDPPPPLRRDVAILRGWALHRSRAVAQVELFLNGRSLGPARLGQPRPDIVRALGTPAGHLCGFQLEVDLAELAPEQEAIEVRASLRSLDGGEMTLKGWTAPLAAAPPSPRRQPRLGFEPRPLPRRHGRGARESALRAVAFAHDLGLGGGQLYLLELLAGLRQRHGLESRVLAPAPGPLQEQFERRGVPVEILGGYPVHDIRAYEAAVARAAERAVRHEPDLVVANTVGAFLGVDVAERLERPSLWSIHESFAPSVFWEVGHSSPMDPQVRYRAERALWTATATLFAARETRELYSSHVAAERAAVMPYGIDLGRWSKLRGEAGRGDARRRLGLAADAEVVLCAGTVEPRKGQTRAAQAFAEIAGRHPRAVLVFLGDAQGAYSAALAAYVAGVGLAPRVRIEPLAADVLPWFEAADVLLLASDVESLPFVLLEGMAQQLCVAASAVFGVPSLIDDGQNGLLFPPNDIAALARALERALALDGAERRRLGAAAALRVRERHDLDRYVDDCRELMRKLAVGRDGEPVARVAAPGAEPPPAPGRHAAARAPGPSPRPSPEAVRAEKLAFVHVPKTAGTFVDAYLTSRVLAPMGYAIYNAGASGIARDWLPEELERIRRRQDRLAYVHNHAGAWPASALRRFRQAGFLRFAFVRHPGDQWCSYYHWALAELRAGRPPRAVPPDDLPWLEAASLDAFLRELIAGRRLGAARRGMQPPPASAELDFVAEFGTEAFAAFLARHLAHEYEPMPPLNASASRGYRSHLAAGEIRPDTDAALRDTAEYRLFLGLAGPGRQR